jgi:hypothetical protein
MNFPKIGKQHSYMDVPTSCIYNVILFDEMTIALRPLSNLLRVPIWVLIPPDTSTSALWLQQVHLVAKQGVSEKWPSI